MVAPVTAECSSWLTRSPGNLRERSSSRRSRGLIDVLAHLGALSRGKRRPRGPGDRVAGSERRRAFTRAPMIAPVPVERPDIRPVPGPLRGAAPPPSTRPARARESLPHPSGAIEPFSPGIAVRGPGAGAGAGCVARGYVRICCKGTPSRDRRREEARNINDSLRAPRRDRGLCNGFGQPAPPRSPRVAPRVGRRPRWAPP